VIGGSVAFCVLSFTERDRPEKTLVPLIGGAGVAALSKMPDFIEPAFNHHHRQFFHSLTFAGILGFSAKRLYEWQPTDPLEKLLRAGLLAAIAAYLIHLACDFMTTKSLPVLGRL
jgi:membrane-bound metal-dependent hydrolase YbcI (DUF457 family)